MAPLYDYVCPECNLSVEVLEDYDSKSKHTCVDCGEKMFRAIGLPCPPRFGRGTPGSASEAEWSARQQAALAKRSNDYDQSPQGKEEIDKVKERHGLLK